MGRFTVPRVPRPVLDLHSGDAIIEVVMELFGTRRDDSACRRTAWGHVCRVLAESDDSVMDRIALFEPWRGSWS